MSYRSPFAAAFEEQQELEAARRALAAPALSPAAAAAAAAASSSLPAPGAKGGDWPASLPPGFRNLAAGQQSDHLVLVAAFDVWRCAARAGGQAGAARTARHYRLSPQALEAIAELREQFAAMLADVRLLQPPPERAGAGGRGGGRGRGRGAARSRGRGGGGGGGGRGRGAARGDDGGVDGENGGDDSDDSDDDDDGQGGAHLSHLHAAVSWADDPSAPHNRLAAAPEMVKAVLAAALAPRVAVFAPSAGGGASGSGMGGGGGGDATSRPAWLAGAAREAVAVHPGSVNHPLARHQWRHPQLVYLEKAGGGQPAGNGGERGGERGERPAAPQRVYLRDTTAVSAAALLLFAGGAPLVLHDEAAVVVGGWLRLRVAPAAAVLIRQLRAALDELLAAAVGGGGAVGGGAGAGGGAGTAAAAVAGPGAAALASRVVDAIRLLLAEAEARPLTAS